MSKTLTDILTIIKDELINAEVSTNILSSSVTAVFISLPEVEDVDVASFLSATGSFYDSVNIIDTVIPDTGHGTISVACGEITTNNGPVTTGIANVTAFLSNNGDKSITGRNVGYGTINNSLSLSSRFILKDSGIQTVFSGQNGTCLEHDFTFLKKRGDISTDDAYKYMHVLRTGQIINERLRTALRKYIGSTEETAPEIDKILIDSLNDLKQINSIEYQAETNFMQGTINIFLNIELANELTFKLLVGV